MMSNNNIYRLVTFYLFNVILTNGSFGTHLIIVIIAYFTSNGYVSLKEENNISWHFT